MKGERKATVAKMQLKLSVTSLVNLMENTDGKFFEVIIFPITLAMLIFYIIVQLHHIPSMLSILMLSKNCNFNNEIFQSSLLFI